MRPCTESSRVSGDTPFPGPAGLTSAMRIAQIAPAARPVRPDAYDSIGQLVYLLISELVSRGHQLVLFGTGDSVGAAPVEALYPRGYVDDERLWDWHLRETLNAAHAFERASEFDVIHSHAYEFALPFSGLVNTPVIHTYHVDLDPDVARAFSRNPAATVAAISAHQRAALASDRAVPVIHHGIDIDAFPFGAQPGDYLLFLGRLIFRKGAAEAIAAAKAVGMPLVLAGPAHEEPDYYARRIQPHLDGVDVRYVGDVQTHERNRLLAGAAALVYPIQAPEPFGLVIVEAMACGTPVAAMGIGAAPELIDRGVTGYCAGSATELARLIPAAIALDRATVRARARERFDYRRMVDAYEGLYRSLAAPVD